MPLPDSIKVLSLGQVKSESSARKSRTALESRAVIAKRFPGAFSRRRLEFFRESAISRFALSLRTIGYHFGCLRDVIRNP